MDFGLLGMIMDRRGVKELTRVKKRFLKKYGIKMVL
jgi:hypothetical protein|tara:strand:- start:57 stop:164 length:108 start_codon:yes stop_codon:yes gene_type:complete